MYVKLISTLLLSAVSLGAIAEDLSHPLLVQMKANGMSVSSTDSLPKIEGLTPWLISDPDGGNKALLYSTKNQDIVLSAQAMDRLGNDPVATWLANDNIANNDPQSVAAAKQVLAANPQVKVAPPALNQEGDAAWKALGETLQINPKNEDLKNNKILYVFVDPNCSACAQFWPHQERYQGNGVTFRMIPVSFVSKQNGYQKITSMGMTNDPHKAYAINEMMFSTGGYPTVPANEKVVQRMELNFQLMTKLGIMGTPTVVYLNQEGKTKTADILDDQFFEMVGGKSSSDDKMNEKEVTSFSGQCSN